MEPMASFAQPFCPRRSDPIAPLPRLVLQPFSRALRQGQLAANQLRARSCTHEGQTPKTGHLVRALHHESYKHIHYMQEAIFWYDNQFGEDAACIGIFAMPMHLRQA